MEKKIRPAASQLVIRPYTFKDICLAYEMSYKAMRKVIKPFLRELGAVRGSCFNLHQVEKIIIYLDEVLEKPVQGLA